MRGILDIACGPGTWAIGVAHEYLHIQVTGIDISRSMVEYARAAGWSQRLNNATILVGSALEPLNFPDNSFDMVNARAMSGFMSREDWPKPVKECKRVLRPGGIIRLTEIEHGISNSPATEELSGHFLNALYLSGRSFSPDGRNLGITAMLGELSARGWIRAHPQCAAPVRCLVWVGSVCKPVSKHHGGAAHVATVSGQYAVAYRRGV